MDAAQRVLDQVEPSGGGIGRWGTECRERFQPGSREIARLPIRGKAFQKMDGRIVARGGQDGDERLLDAGDRASMLGDLDCAAQGLLEFRRAPRWAAIADQCDRVLADDQGGALAAQPTDADAVPFEQPYDRVDPAQRVQQMFEAYLGRPVGQRQIEGVVAAGEQRLVDPECRVARAAKCGGHPARAGGGVTARLSVAKWNPQIQIFTPVGHRPQLQL